MNSIISYIARIAPILLLTGLFSMVFESVAQDSNTTDSNKKLKDLIQLRGYLKDMGTTNTSRNLFSGSPKYNVYSDNLIHNRLNLRITPSEKISIGIENRNRIFWGESIKLNPTYGASFDRDPGLIDLSFNIIDDPAVVMNSTIDRAWFNYASAKWEFRAGRQRINWGINNFWNSNDIFNAYNFTDFDYEERPGSDALKFVRYFNEGMNSVEVAISPSKDDKKWVGGMLYKFNKSGYDFQILGGWMHTDYVLGAGWAGNIKNNGFKGEATYFHPSEKLDSVGNISASLSTEFMVKGKYFTTIGLLFNSGGFYNSSTFNGNAFSGQLSAKNLMPTKLSFLANQMYPITPLTNLAFIVMYSPGVNLALFMPSLSYSISQSWDVGLFAQCYFMETSRFTNLGNSVFLRLKWSF